MADKKISALTGATTPLDGTEVLPIVQSGATVKVANNDLRPKQIQSNATSGVLQVAGPAAAATRVMTTPDANFTAARIDAGQTFTGAQQVNGLLSLNTASSGLQTGRSMSFLTTGGCIGYLSHSTSDGNGDPYFLFGYNGAEIGSIVQYGTTSVNFKPGSGGGINFSANTPAAGMTSQLLNWYEEGTWTPNQGAGLTVVGAFSSNGTYTRIGRQVTVSGILFGATSILVTTNGIITANLPFEHATGQATGVCLDAARSSSTLIIASGFNIYGSAATSAASYIFFSITYTI